MSSPLDGRIRSIAREEATALLGVPGGVQSVAGSAPTAEQLQEQITYLHEHLHLAATKLSNAEERIRALEKAAGHAESEERPTARRTPRKTDRGAPAPE
jgi:hypothetical protein